MLSDEEKKAIDYLQFCYSISTISNESLPKLGIVLNLIEKQSKEIEELKEKNRQSKMRIVQLENEITARIEDVNQYYTPNDKIKAKIEELDYNDISNFERRCKQEVLQSLLDKE